MKRSRSKGAPAGASSHEMTDDRPSVLVVRVDGDEAPPIAPDPSLLESFTYPLGSGAFTQRFFRRKAVAFVGAGPDRVQQLIDEDFCAGDVRELANATASEKVHAWFRPYVPSHQSNGSASAHDGAGASSSKTRRKTSSSVSAAISDREDRPTFAAIDSLKLDDAASAMTAHAAGASLYFQSSKEAASAYVPAMSECLGQAFSAYYDSAQAEHRGEIEVFVSRGGHVTYWHYDFQENFTLQLRGRKRWRLKAGAVASVLRGATPHFRTAEDVIEQQVKAARLAGDSSFSFWPGAEFFADADVIELAPGDALYFPAGGWHQVEAVDDSLSINISLSSLTWAELGGAAVRHLLTKDDGWRQMITTDPRAALPLENTSGGASLSASVVDTDGAGAESQPAKKQKKASGKASAAVSSSSSSSSSALARMSSSGTSGPALSHASTSLPVGLHAHLSSLLARLRSCVGSLRPEHLCPPASLLSLRWGGVPTVPSWLMKEAEQAQTSDSGRDGAHDDGDDENDDENEDEDEGSSSGDDDSKNHHAHAHVIGWDGHSEGCGTCGDDNHSNGSSSEAGREALLESLKAARLVSPHFLVWQHEGTLHLVVDGLLHEDGSKGNETASESKSPGSGGQRGKRAALPAASKGSGDKASLVPSSSSSVVAPASSPAGASDNVTTSWAWLSLNPLALLLREGADMLRHVAAQEERNGSGSTASSSSSALPSAAGAEARGPMAPTVIHRAQVSHHRSGWAGALFVAASEERGQSRGAEAIEYERLLSTAPDVKNGRYAALQCRWSSYIAHVNCGNDDLTSGSRVIIHIPTLNHRSSSYSQAAAPDRNSSDASNGSGNGARAPMKWGSKKQLQSSSSSSWSDARASTADNDNYSSAMSANEVTAAVCAAAERLLELLVCATAAPLPGGISELYPSVAPRSSDGAVSLQALLQAAAASTALLPVGQPRAAARGTAAAVSPPPPADSPVQLHQSAVKRLAPLLEALAFAGVLCRA